MDPARAEQAFIAKMASAHGFGLGSLKALFAQAKVREDILRIIAKPAEAARPWHAYRPIFVNKDRIQGGVEFWRANAAALSAAAREYGVPAEIIVAILGVETRYGGNMGSHRVFDALTTLAFHYPPRAIFFSEELENYLLLTREQGLDPLALKGSYAGAMGLAQFIPSSYRRFSVDFDGDGITDLWDSRMDAIGSIANYFRVHGWKNSEPVVVRAKTTAELPQDLQDLRLEPRLTVRDFEEHGVRPAIKLDPNQPATLFSLESAQETEHWLGLYNFYVITRYNRSRMYAMAVYELGQEILKRHSQAMP